MERLRHHRGNHVALRRRVRTMDERRRRHRITGRLARRHTRVLRTMRRTRGRARTVSGRGVRLLVDRCERRRLDLEQRNRRGRQLDPRGRRSAGSGEHRRTARGVVRLLPDVATHTERLPRGDPGCAPRRPVRHRMGVHRLRVVGQHRRPERLPHDDGIVRRRLRRSGRLPTVQAAARRRLRRSQR